MDVTEETLDVRCIVVADVVSCWLTVAFTVVPAVTLTTVLVVTLTVLLTIIEVWMLVGNVVVVTGIDDGALNASEISNTKIKHS